MPRPKSWISRIPAILKHLEADTTPLYTRRQVDELFQLGADQAAELMQVVGLAAPPRPGVAGMVQRLALLAYVRNCREGQAALQEFTRREKLAKRLKAAEADLILRKVRLRVTRRDEWASFDDLPNVSIKPGRMEVEFTAGDPVDLLDTLFRLVKAAGNDWGSFEKMCEGLDTHDSEQGGSVEGAAK